MKKFILYSHGGSGNHGCEALVRTTKKVLNADKENILLISDHPEEDIKYQIDDLVKTIKSKTTGYVPRNTDFFKAYLDLKLHKDYSRMSNLEQFYGSGAKKGDIALSIGGDTYCYGFTKSLQNSHQMWVDKKIKTVFWGCSLEPDLLKNPLIAKDIKSFDLITARETISYEALRRINPNTVLVADTAFLLEKQEVDLPAGFGNRGVIGINISPLAINNETIPGITLRNLYLLLDHIIKNTSMDIMLVPHVIWQHDDDRTILGEIYKTYEKTNRFLFVEDNNCEVLKGYISKCNFFIGARTHATIAAYSMGIPTLVIGYSVKSKGIAQDLFGTYENYVLPVQSLSNDNDLLNSFLWIQKNETSIHNRLNSFIPEYVQRIENGLNSLKAL